VTPARLAWSAIGIALFAALIWFANPFDIRGVRKAAKVQAVTATQQAAVATKTTEVLDRVVRSEVIIRNQAQGAIEHVEQAQGAETPLPPAVAASVRAGVDGLRKRSGAGDDQPSGQPASAM
jgi:hypothetical protein